MSAVFEKNRTQLASVEECLVWLTEKIAKTSLAKMDPMPVTTSTYYHTVVLNGEIPNALFSEHGRA